MPVSGVGSDWTAPVRRLERVVVPVGLAVVTWLVVLLAVGTLARLGTVSVLKLLSLFVVAVLFWPLALARPWRPGVTGRVRRSVVKNRWAILLAVVLALSSVVPVVPGQVRGLLNLPYRSAGVLFGASLFYRQQVDPFVGRALLRFGQWYLTAFWLFVIASILTRIGRGVRGVIR